MEVFFKNLSAEGIQTDRLVGDLVALVEDTETFLKNTGAALAQESRDQLLTRLERVKVCSAKIREHALAGARATDKIIRGHPYSSLGLVLIAGMALGFLAGRQIEARN